MSINVDSSNNLSSDKPLTSQSMNDITLTSVVFISGWGADKQTWRLFAPLLLECLQNLTDVIYIDPKEYLSVDQFPKNAESFIERIAHTIPDNSVIIGWSLGGMIATRLAHAYPKTCSVLITLATNLRFVANRNWPTAMEPATFKAFSDAYVDEPKKTAQRFAALQAQNDQNKRDVALFLKSYSTLNQIDDVNACAHLLAMLAELDNTQLIHHIAQPHLAIFGEGDTLVPMAAGHNLSQIFSDFGMTKNAVKILDNCGHALHISQPQNILSFVISFLRKNKIIRVENKQAKYIKNKSQIAQSFNKAASTYDGVAQLQRQVADQLLKIKFTYEGTIADIGCGTGYCSEQLLCHPKTNIERIVHVDLAQNMLSVAREKMTPLQLKNHPAIQLYWTCGDMELLPLANASMQGMVSSLCVQWSDNLTVMFSEAHRVLADKGWFLLATLGPNTLHELQASWQSADPNYVHVNRFFSELEVLDAANDAGFHVLDFASENCVMKYNNALQLMRELKALGAHNVNAGSNHGLTGRHKLRALTEYYETYRGHDNLLPATYDVIYVLLEKS